jgi:hypothetical protein
MHRVVLRGIMVLAKGREGVRSNNRALLMS